jgi:hypothetical protein
VVDLGLPASAKPEEAISMVWVEYWDERRIGHWRDTWRVGTAFHSSGRLLQADSELVD